MNITISNLPNSKLATPKGRALYSYLTKPDTSTYGKNRYRLTIVFDEQDPAFAEFEATLEGHREVVAENTRRDPRALPIKRVDEKTAQKYDLPLGAPYMEFTSNGLDKDGNVLPAPDVYGPDRQLQPGAKVFGGDTVRASITVKQWELTDGVGVKAYLDTVQLLKSNWTGGGANLFDVEEEYLENSDAPEEDNDADAFEDESDAVSESDVFGDGDGEDSLL